MNPDSEQGAHIKLWNCDNNHDNEDNPYIVPINVRKGNTTAGTDIFDMVIFFST